MPIIYLLYSEELGLPIYVGYTSRSLSARKSEHDKWIIDELKFNCQVLVLENLQIEDQSGSWRSAERKWILFFRTITGIFDLHILPFNKSPGGNAFSSEAARIAASRSHSNEADIKRTNTRKERGNLGNGGKIAGPINISKATEAARSKDVQIKRIATTKRNGNAGKGGHGSLGKHYQSRIDSNKRWHEEVRSIVNELNVTYREAIRIRRTRKEE